MSHNKYGPDRFSRFDVYWIQTNKETDRQTHRQAKYIYKDRYSWKNGWTKLADNFGGNSCVLRVTLAKQIMEILKFHGQRRALQLVKLFIGLGLPA